MRIDFTLTLPGMFEVENIQQLSWQLDADVLAKVVFSFTPDIIMSPLALPRHILDRKIDELIPCVQGALKDVLTQLKSRLTFNEQWPETWQDGLRRGKQRVLRLEHLRDCDISMDDILKKDDEIYEWWTNIPTD